MIKERIGKQSALGIIQLKSEDICLYALHFKGCKVLHWVGINPQFGAREVNFLCFHKYCIDTDGVKSLVCDYGGIEVKIDSSAVEDGRSAFQIRFLGYAELDKSFARAATRRKINVGECELHDAVAVDFKVVCMAGRSGINRGWIECGRQSVADYDLLHGGCSGVAELD